MPKLGSRRFTLYQIAYNTLVTANIRAKFQWIHSYKMFWNCITLSLLWISDSASAPWQIACCYNINCAAFRVDYTVIFSLQFRGKFVESHRHGRGTEQICPERPILSQALYSLINTQYHWRRYFNLGKTVG